MLDREKDKNETKRGRDWPIFKKDRRKVVLSKTRTDTGSRVCGDYILIFREWKRSIDRLTEKILLDGWIDRWIER